MQYNELKELKTNLIKSFCIVYLHYKIIEYIICKVYVINLFLIQKSYHLNFIQFERESWK